MKGADEVKQLRVLYLPKIFEDQVDGEVFPLLSSPTELRLAPGRYVVWARDLSSGRQSERTTVRLGSGKSAEILQIPAP